MSFAHCHVASVSVNSCPITISIASRSSTITFDLSSLISMPVVDHLATYPELMNNNLSMSLMDGNLSDQCHTSSQAVDVVESGETSSRLKQEFCPIGLQNTLLSQNSCTLDPSMLKPSDHDAMMLRARDTWALVPEPDFDPSIFGLYNSPFDFPDLNAESPESNDVNNSPSSLTYPSLPDLSTRSDSIQSSVPTQDSITSWMLDQDLVDPGASSNETTAPTASCKRIKNRERYRTKNRTAAAKCRAKKKSDVETLEADHRTQNTLNTALRHTAQTLRDELSFWRTQALQHSYCGCDSIQRFNMLQAQHMVGCAGSHVHRA